MSDSERKLNKTFGGVLSDPVEMEKARQNADVVIATESPSAPQTTDNSVATRRSALLDRQAEVAKRFEVGMDKITDVLLVVGLKLSQGSRTVVAGLAGVFVLMAFLIVVSLILVGKFNDLHHAVQETIEAQNTILASQLKSEELIRQTLKKAEEAKDRAEAAARKAEELDASKATLSVEHGKPIIEFPNGDEGTQRIELPRSTLQP
jgi:ABC-type multidrug transport system fused ATPase/permease subunit